MNILIIDTATEACSVALQYNTQVVADYAICPQQHSQRILPMVEGVLAQAGIALSDLDALGFGRGPGSFTGVRIATGIVQGLALGADLPVVGISTLAAMAQQVMANSEHQQVAVAIDARMSEVYFAQYSNEQGIASLQQGESVAAPEDVLALLNAGNTGFAGTGWEAYAPLTAYVADNPVTVSFPNARYMLPLAIRALTQGEGAPAKDVTPVYVRDTVTWKKLPGR